MTKVQLQEKIKELEAFKKQVEKGVIQILKDADICEEKYDVVKAFCEQINIKYPTKKITIEVEMDLDVEIEQLETTEDSYVDYEVLKETIG